MNRRFDEYEEYLGLVLFLERFGDGHGVVPCGSTMETADLANRYVLSKRNEKVLKATVYLQLYNIVESVVAKSLEGLSDAVVSSNVSYVNLSNLWRRRIADTVSVQVEGNGLESFKIKNIRTLLDFCINFEKELPAGFKIVPPMGAVDEGKLDIFSKKYGLIDCNIVVPRDKEDGVLHVIMKARHDLAHGNLSFSDKGANLTGAELKIYFDDSKKVLEQFVAGVEKTILEKAWLNKTEKAEG